MAEYISKKEVLDYLNGYLHSLGYDNTDLIVNGQRHALINVLEDILTVKAADVQPVKHGKWESSQRTIETGTVYCSNCAIEYYISDLQTVGDCNGIVHYCPNCGARMDGDAK
jgi:hypothetical protein